jgi:hypothetical protein
MVQEVGFAKLQALGIPKLIAADSPHSFLDDTPTSKLIKPSAMSVLPNPDRHATAA